MTDSSQIGQSKVFSQKPAKINQSDSLQKISQIFANGKVMPIPNNATNTVYVEGVPLGTTEREVARNQSL